MNILFLALDINLEYKSGDSIHVHELASSFAKLGNEVVLIAADIDKKKESIKWAGNIPKLHLYFNKTGKRFSNVSTLLYCKKIAKKHQVQVIYERRTTPKISVILSKLLGIPGIMELNGLPSLEAEMLRAEQKTRSFARPVRTLISNYMFRSLDGVVAVTKGIKREIIERTNMRENKVFVIQNGANIDLFKPIEQHLCKEKFEFNKNDKYICFVGNLAPWQGLEYLVRASPFIIKEEINAKFLIIGDGMMTETLKKMVENIGMKNSFSFLGAVPYEQVPEYINACDVCVAPFIRARNEIIGLSPLKIYEYLACEKPVVASNIEGVGDFLSETNSGISVEPEDHESLAKGVLKLLKDENKGREMGKNGRKIVTEEHSWDGVAEKVIGVCKSLT